MSALSYSTTHESCKHYALFVVLCCCWVSGDCSVTVKISFSPWKINFDMESQIAKFMKPTWGLPGSCWPRWHSHLQSFATPPPRVAVRRREVFRHPDGRGWEKMENVEFRNFLSITSWESYCISKIIIFEPVSRWLICDYSPRNNTMSHS